MPAARSRARAFLFGSPAMPGRLLVA